MIVWGLELKERVSGAAAAAAEAMNQAAQAAVAMARAVGSAGSSFLGASLAAQYLHDGINRIAAGFGAVLDTALTAGESVKRLTATFEALEGGAAGAGQGTMNMLRQLEKELPQSEATLARWTRQLQAAGITNFSELRDSIKAVASAEALVEGGGEHVQNMLAKLAEQSLKGGGKVKFSLAQLAGTGIGEQEFLTALGMTPENFAAAKKAGTLTGKQVNDAIVKALSTKAAGPLAAQMDELGTVTSKAADMAKRLFEGIDTKPLVDGARQFFSFLDDSQPSGQVLKAAITGAFNAIFSVAGKVLQSLYTGMEHVIIWALEAAIAIKGIPAQIQHVKDVMSAWAPVIAGVAAGIFTLFVPSLYAAVAGVVAWAVTAIPAAIAAGVGYIATMGAAAIATIAATWPLLAIAAAVGLVVFGIYELVKHWDQVKAFFGTLATEAWNAGKAIVEGLVGGIENMISSAVNGVKKLGGAVIGGLKSMLGIASPSRVMFEMGVHTSAGFAGGLGAGTDGVEDAAGGMGGAAMTAGEVGGRSGGGGGSVSQVFNVDVRIEASHAASPQEMASIVEEQIAALAERLALMAGTAPQPA